MNHIQGDPPFGMAVSVNQFTLQDQAVALFHQHMTHASRRPELSIKVAERSHGFEGFVHSEH